MATVEQKRERGNKGIDRKGLWRNGNASDYESEDCRFDPCQARLFNKKVEGYISKESGAVVVSSSIKLVTVSLVLV